MKMEIIIARNGNRYQTLSEYEQSADWDEMRLKRLAIDKYRCRACGSEMNVQVHHTSYEHIGDENPFNDLITLCKNCHRWVHSSSDDRMAKYAPFHWEYYDFDKTVAFIETLIGRDIYIGGDVNLCSQATIRELATEFLHSKYGLDVNPQNGYIGWEDVKTFFKLMRMIHLYKSVFVEKRNLDQMLDELNLEPADRSRARAYYGKHWENEKKVKALIAESYAWCIDIADAIGINVDVWKEQTTNV